MPWFMLSMSVGLQMLKVSEDPGIRTWLRSQRGSGLRSILLRKGYKRI